MAQAQREHRGTIDGRESRKNSEDGFGANLPIGAPIPLLFTRLHAI